MADTTLRTDLDQIATALEKKGRADLASVVDLCNHQIHDRKARASVAKPVRQAATGTDRKSKLRWAATELKAIARDLRKEGSVREAREFMKMADDLMEEIAVEGPVVEGEEPVEGAEMEVEGDEPDADDECPPCPPCDDEPALESVEACARELRVLARELRASKNPQDKITARALLRQAMELEVDPALGTQPAALPPTDGGSDPVDATDFDLSDVPLPELGDEEGGGDVEDIISDEIMDLEGGEPSADAGMPDIEANPETTPSEYVEAALSLARAAVTLEKAGQKVQAAKLIAKAKEFRAAAVRKASATKRPTVASRKPAPKLSPREAAKARFLARSKNR